jgi:hypothetical protein
VRASDRQRVEQGAHVLGKGRDGHRTVSALGIAEPAVVEADDVEVIGQGRLHRHPHPE